MIKPVTLIILGPVGSGKGTQAKFLAEKLDWAHVSTGELLRKRIRIHDSFGRKLAGIMKSGRLVPTWIVFTLSIIEIVRLGPKRGIVLDGNPRSLDQAEMLNEGLARIGRDRIVVLYLWVSEKETMRRLLKRARSDDSLRGIKERIKVFRTQVMPVVRQYQRTQTVFRINGEQSREDVFREIMKKLKTIKII